MSTLQASLAQLRWPAPKALLPSWEMQSCQRMCFSVQKCEGNRERHQERRFPFFTGIGLPESQRQGSKSPQTTSTATDFASDLKAQITILAGGKTSDALFKCHERLSQKLLPVELG